MRLLICPVRDQKETEELSGIHQHRHGGVSPCGLHCLAGLSMSSISGGVRVSDQQGKRRIVHFRTLHWGPNLIRKTVVHLVFVN